MRLALIAAVAALPLSSCGDASEPAPTPEQTGAVADVSAPETAPIEATPAPGEMPDLQTIPAAIQGRWALTEADCTAARGAATGLLRIGPETLTFYESAGTLADIEEANANRIRAEFSFTGEGMTWSRDITLELQDGGAALVRREHGEGAAFRYSKCP
ncbi:hypothetical protein GRI75_10165 [Altererythrobacter soli]|uniref:Uncharacterized protein n=1 Tax=Croceibacterium soli TaxID=1739690 RepID=A0A6I4UWR6_9SPHN|nr:hypothetical protein [Croceibacterium soli]MXP42003.1 hypothetical protein [Croceibacterium soli]